jgi:CHAD domain-containing protein
VAVGLGVALAKAGRERVRLREQLHEREFALLPGERLAAGMQRMALGQVDLAIELLGGHGGPLDERAVHETRKALKRLRALLRLLRGELGERVFASENAVLGDLGARLAGARDSEVALATLNGLIARHPRKLERRGGVLKLRRRLSAERERMEQLTLGDERTRAEVLSELRAFGARVSAWRLPDRGASALVEPGLRAVYTQGRRRYRRAAAGKGERARTMHEWRKRVKDLRYAAELLQRHEPKAAAHRGKRSRGKAAGKQARSLRRLARRADELGEMLGEDHDLVLLAALIRAGSSGGARGEAPIPRRTRKLLLKLIARRRRQLRQRALRAGERLYRESPKRFIRRVRAAHASERSRLS